jgi:hypothetical protein
LLDHPRLINQICGLERRTARGGRDSIDHSPGNHDDVANAVAGAIVAAAARDWQAAPTVVPYIWGNRTGPSDTKIGGLEMTTTEKFYQFYGSGGHWWGPV